VAFRNAPEDRREENGVVYYQRTIAFAGDPEDGGTAYHRLAIQTHFVERGESYVALMARYAKPLVQPGDILSLSEKIISMCQDNVVEKKDVRVGFWAKFLSRFAASNKHGIAMDEPYKLQLAINLAGLPRILLAAFCSAVTKLFGKKGVFYKIAGHGIDGIDGFYMASSFEVYRDIALLNPREPDTVCREIEESLGIPCVLVDANDLSIRIFGRSPSMTLPEDDIIALLKDNPAGQSDELTPLILMRPC
jgi:F420-0:gamma-glutamyl ligase-like protein